MSALLPQQNQPDRRAEIEREIMAMHEAYVRGSGLAITLDMERLRAWWELHRRQFRAVDVATLCAFLKLEIRKAERTGKGRNPGCLRFRNFTAVDQFEEDLAAARAALKLTRPASAPKPAGEGKELATVEDIREALAKLKGGAERP